MKEESKITLNELAETHGLTFWSTSYTDQGNSYQYMDPYGINVIINEWDKSFQMKWMVPNSIFTIECPSCSPYDHPGHFERIYKRFVDVVTTYRCGVTYM